MKQLKPCPPRQGNEITTNRRDQPIPAFFVVLLDGLFLVDLRLLLDLLDIEVSHGSFFAVDDLGELLEGGALSLDVHLKDEGELEQDPDL